MRTKTVFKSEIPQDGRPADPQERGKEKVRLTKSLNGEDDPGDNHAPGDGQGLTVKSPVSSEKRKRPLKLWQYARVRPPEATVKNTPGDRQSPTVNDPVSPRRYKRPLKRWDYARVRPPEAATARRQAQESDQDITPRRGFVEGEEKMCDLPAH